MERTIRNHRSLRLGAFFHHGLALLVLFWCGVVQAQVPQLLNYQGFLSTPGGTPINASVVMTIKLYDASSGGSVLYTEIQPSVSVNNGVFNAVIGSINPLTLPFNAPYWLTVTINADGEMNPRQQVTASAYALRAANADALAKGGTAGQMLTGTGSVPAWSGSPALSGNLTLVTPSTATTGNILKGANRFIHNFGSLNTFIGENAGNFTMTGSANTGSGAGALAGNSGGNLNTASGWNALASNATGSQNTATGINALAANTSGNYNTGYGANALSANTTGINNTATGRNALRLNSTGYSNVAVGVQALESNSTGANNAAVGTAALNGNDSGSLNTAIGDNALVSNVSGNNNIAVGYYAGSNLTTGANNIDIGSTGVAGESGTIRIGLPGFQSLAYIQGIYNAPALFNGATVFVEPDGRLGTNPSSRRYKDDIADMSEASNKLMNLRPVTFHYKNDHNPAGRTLQYGLVAEEVAVIYPGLVARSADGQIEAVMYQFLAPMLLNEYQRLQRTIEAQAVEIAMLKQQTAEIAAVKRQVEQIARFQQQSASLAALDAPTGLK